MHIESILLRITTILLLGLTALPVNANFVTFESGQVRPLAISPDGNRLFVVNTPDNTLEIFDINSGAPTHGDVNVDGMVNTADLVIVTRIALGIKTANATEQLHADVAPQTAGVPVPDGQINAADVLLIQLKIFGLKNF